MTQHAAGQRAGQAAVSSIQQQHAMQQMAATLGGGRGGLDAAQEQAAAAAAAAANSQYLILRVERSNPLPMALNALASASPEELRRELKVAFPGRRAWTRGVRKEFFQLLVEQLFSESFGMFVNVNKGALVAEQLWFSKDCVWSDDEFELTGTLISLAVYNGVLLDLHFPHVVYKKLIALDSPQRRPLTLSDVASLDGDLAKGLTQLLEYEPAGDVEAVFCLNFEVTWTSFGATHRAELVEGGAGVAVTGGNRERYVERYVQWLLRTASSSSSAPSSAASIKSCSAAAPAAAVRGAAAASGRHLAAPAAGRGSEAIVSGTPQLDFRRRGPWQPTRAVFCDHPAVRLFWEVVLEDRNFDEQKRCSRSHGLHQGAHRGLGKPSKVQRSGPDSASSDSPPASRSFFPSTPSEKMARCSSSLARSKQACRAAG